MKKLVVVLLIIPIMGFALPTIDGVITPDEGWELVGVSAYPNGGGEGANLNQFFYALSEDTLYLAITTNNTASWNVAYGFGIDYIPEYGYFEGDNDAWGRRMNFTETYAIDDEVYFWWDGGASSITSANTCVWLDGSWDYRGVDNFAWTGGGDGLQTLEIAVSWATLSLPTKIQGEEVNLSTWIAGDGGSSAVDVIPYNESVSDGGGDEWTDSDTITAYFTATLISETDGREFISPVKVRGDILEITSESPGKAIVNIYDITGRHVGTPFNGIIEGTKRIKVELSSGVYFYSVTLSGKKYTGKFVVVR